MARIELADKVIDSAGTKIALLPHSLLLMLKLIFVVLVNAVNLMIIGLSFIFKQFLLDFRCLKSIL